MYREKSVGTHLEPRTTITIFEEIPQTLTKKYQQNKKTPTHTNKMCIFFLTEAVDTAVALMRAQGMEQKSAKSSWLNLEMAYWQFGATGIICHSPVLFFHKKEWNSATYLPCCQSDFICGVPVFNTIPLTSIVSLEMTNFDWNDLFFITQAQLFFLRL